MYEGRGSEHGSKAACRLILFLAGEENNSRIARENLDRIRREGGLPGGCEVKIIDVLEDFEAAVAYNILVTPSLLVVEPAPPQLIFGNLSDTQKVLELLHRQQKRYSYDRR